MYFVTNNTIQSRWRAALFVLFAVCGACWAIAAAAESRVSLSDVGSDDFIRKDGQRSVHYVNEDGKRQFLPFEWTYKTWREDFSQVKVVDTGTDLDQYFPSAPRPLVGPRPGSVLLTSPDTSRIYAMGCHGTLHWLENTDVIRDLYGNDWELHDLPGYLLSLFPQGGSLDGSRPHCGQVVRFVAGGDVYVVGEDDQYYRLTGALPSVVNRIRVINSAQRNARVLAALALDTDRLIEDPSQRRTGLLRRNQAGQSNPQTPGGGGNNQNNNQNQQNPPQITSDVVITRLTGSQPTSTDPSQGPVILTHFEVQTPHAEVTLHRTTFFVDLTGQLDTDSGIRAGFNKDVLFSFEHHDGNSWREVASSSFTGARQVRLPLTNSVTLVSGNQLRLRVDGLPCAAVGSTIEADILDDRGNLTFLIDTPTVSSTTDVDYTAVSNPLRVGTCIGKRYQPLDPILWYRFEETAVFKPDLYDASGNKNGTDMAVELEYQQPGARHEGVRFLSAATSSHAEVPTYLFINRPLSFAEPVTVEMMIKPEQLGVWQGLVSKGNGVDAYDYHFAISPNNKLSFYTEQDGGVWYEGTQTLTTGTWKHVGMTLGGCANSNGFRKDCTLKFYIDGAEDTVTIMTAGNHPSSTQVRLGNPTSHPVTIGAWSGTRKLFSYVGLMDELVIYDRVLSASDMVDRYKTNNQ